MKIIIKLNKIQLYDFIEPDSKLGKFNAKLKSLVNNEEEFYKYISSIKYIDLYQFSFLSLIEVFNYIDVLLFKYSNNINEFNIRHKIVPLIDFTYLLLKKCLLN